MRIAVLPARGGSKRIPRKNIRLFAGRPMIAWPLKVVRECGLFDHIVVSTDDNEIAAIALEHGAEVPFIRPAELSDDLTGTTKVMAHAVEWALLQGWAVEAACCIYPTAPMILPSDLVDGLKMLESGNWKYVLTATDFAAPIFRAFQQEASGGLQMFWPENFIGRSQDLPRALHDAGQFYWGQPQAWLEEEVLFGPYSAPLLIPRWRVQDIDTLEDWTRAELLFRSARLSAEA